MKKEVIELNIIWYGGQLGFCLDEHSSKINDRKLNLFGKKLKRWVFGGGIKSILIGHQNINL